MRKTIPQSFIQVFKESEKEAQNVLLLAIKRRGEIEAQVIHITRAFDTQIDPGVFPHFLDSVEEIGASSLTEYIARNKLRERYAASPPTDSQSILSISNQWQHLRESIDATRHQMRLQMKDLDEEIPLLTEKAHRMKVDRLSLEFGKASVDLTNRNILISILLPVLIFLLGTIAFEAFKPEVIDWIRHLFGLASLSK